MDLIRPEMLVIPREHWGLLSPYLIVFFSACVAILASTLPEKANPKYLVPSICGIGLVAAVAQSICLLNSPVVTLFGGMMISDPLSHFLNIFYCILGGLVLMSSHSYLTSQRLRYTEFDILLVFSILGMMLMTSTQHLIVMFLALELMSLSVYVLVGFRRSDKRSNEAAIKYYILGSAASAVLLYGMALLYGSTMSFHLGDILSKVQANAALFSPVLMLGGVLLIVGFLFKTATVPFHMWMPDVYEGAPLPVTAFMTGALKFAVFAAFIRVLMGLDFDVAATQAWGLSLQNILWITAALTMFAGNLIALMQTNLKRMLAYSSIAHTGYLLIGVLAGTITRDSYSNVVFYLVIYAFMNIGAFTILGALAGQGDSDLDLRNVGGLAAKRPWLALILAIFLFSMAGIPPTGGFLSKYFLFNSGVQVGAVGLVVLGVLCSAVSVYFYLRVIVYMYMKPAEGAPHVVTGVSPATQIAIGVSLAAVLVLGLFPTLLLGTVGRLF